MEWQQSLSQKLPVPWVIPHNLDLKVSRREYPWHVVSQWGDIKWPPPSPDTDLLLRKFSLWGFLVSLFCQYLPSNLKPGSYCGCCRSTFLPETTNRVMETFWEAEWEHQQLSDVLIKIHSCKLVTVNIILCTYFN